MSEGGVWARNRLSPSHLTTPPPTQFERDRLGQQADLYLVKRVLHSMYTMCCYEENAYVVYIQAFQQPFIDMTKEFYRQESVRYLQSHDSATYMIRALERIDQEATR